MVRKKKVLQCLIHKFGKQGMGVQSRGKRGKKNEGKLGSEVESGVIKIHPTVQTKGGMKKGENAGEKRG